MADEYGDDWAEKMDDSERAAIFARRSLIFAAEDNDKSWICSPVPPSLRDLYEKVYNGAMMRTRALEPLDDGGSDNAGKGGNEGYKQRFAERKEAHRIEVHSQLRRMTRERVELMFLQYAAMEIALGTIKLAEKNDQKTKNMWIALVIVMSAAVAFLIVVIVQNARSLV